MLSCGEEIIEREYPVSMAGEAPVGSGHSNAKVGKYTIRRQAWDENWKEITEDTFYHESCYYRGFVSAIATDLSRTKMFDETDAKEMVDTVKEKGLPE